MPSSAPFDIVTTKLMSPIPSSPFNFLGKSIRDFRLTLVALVYFIICLLIACFGNALADRLNPNNHLPVSERRALPDPLMQFLHPLFLNLDLPKQLSDILLGMSLLLGFARLLTLRSMTMTAFRRVFLIAGTIYVLRAVTVVSTVLPNPLLECKSEPHENLLIDTFQLFFMQRTSCGDVFFSGHTLMFTISALVWTTYSQSSFFRALATTISVIGAFSLVFSAYHYTIDVLAAYWITSWLWNMYHLTIRTPSLRNKTWWGRILNVFDNSEYFKKEDCQTDDDMVNFAGYLEVISVTDE